MSEDSRRDDQENTVHLADTKNIIKDAADAPVERKEEYLKRVKKEDESNKKIYQKSGSYIVFNGYKVLVKFKNKAGSVYTRYWFNAKRHKEKAEKIKRDKGCEVDGKFLKLRKE